MAKYMTLDGAAIYYAQKEYKKHLLEKIDEAILEDPTITVQEIIDLINEDEIEKPEEIEI